MSGRQRHVARVHLEDQAPSFPVGRQDRNPAVEAARPQQRLVEHVDAVRRPDHDHAVDESKPSISVRIWFSVCSRSSLPPP